MDRRLALILTLGLFAAPLAGARRPGHTWVVVAPETLDERLQRQLDSLAAHDQALIEFARTARAAARVRMRPGNLAVELHPESSVQSLLEALKRETANSALAPTLELAREGYILEAFYPRATVPNRLRITAATPEGFHNALLRVPDLLATPPSQLVTLIPRPQAVRVERGGATALIADYPSFPVRGIVEGFYGTPWSHGDRLNMLRFEGQHGMNVYYYAPKDDPYHRKLWREPYPPAPAAKLRELVHTARANFVDFCFAISPGLSMTYSSDADFSTLVNKLAGVGKMGVSCYALFLDDVPQALQNPADQAQFKTLAQAHIFVINKLYNALKSQSPRNRLTVTPTVYTDEWGSRDYIQELGAGVDPGVALVWTGPKVASPEITVAQARAWGAYLHRPPLVWDNFPVNDGRRWRLHLGPMRGRDADLPGAIAGLFSNPMNQARASQLPLETIADYLWNSRAYDPEQSHAHALVRQYGKDAPTLLATYLKTYDDYWWDENIFTPLFAERRYPIDVAAIQERTSTLEASLGSLRTRPLFAPLLAEISPFPEMTRERLAKVSGDPAFSHLSDGKLQWREDYDGVTANRLAAPIQLDGDFAKWASGPLRTMNETSQISHGAKLWKGAEQLAAHVGLAWDDNYLYVGVDITDPQLYQPFFARGIEKGDVFILDLETAFRKNFTATQFTGEEYSLLFSPGDFASVKPSIYSDEDYLPPRLHPHDYNQEIKTAWKKTPTGYSGDIAIPVSFFAGGQFSKGYEIGCAFGVQKAFPPQTPEETEEPRRIVLTSKADALFRVSVDNPATFPRLMLVESTQ
ncbi:MAG: beta-N-acetylglucosaminidase domain-containing protein [Acidobacteriia bacterium]|nr:beta-N-acetylglucosaminidase domain-containing protein [Terriglobia bacterium]